MLTNYLTHQRSNSTRVAHWFIRTCVFYPPSNSFFTPLFQSVFKAYDTDKDGSLSEEDYQLLSLNFPALDPFSTVDKNK